TESKTLKLELSEIRMDSEIQPRTGNDEAVIREYAAAMREGAGFPPVVVFNDGNDHWLSDGFHRVLAAKEAGLGKIEAVVCEGTPRDAILYAAAANATHGLRRTNADKRRVVGTLLEDDEWGAWSDHEIARKCSVSQPFVTKVRNELSKNGYQWDSKRKCADGRTIDTANIGKGSMPDPQEKLPDEPQKAVQDGESNVDGISDATPESASDHALDQSPARKPDDGDITCVVAEFGSKPVKGDNGDPSPSVIHNALSMTVPEAVEFLINGVIPKRPEVIMSASDFLKVLINFSKQEISQKEMKVIITGKKTATVA
ncbi:ParB N-terminal domain-containing protein, partial [bacterium]